MKIQEMQEMINDLRQLIDRQHSMDLWAIDQLERFDRQAVCQSMPELREEYSPPLEPAGL